VKKLLRILAQKPLYERKCHARLTREYTDGGANICAENEIDTLDNINTHVSLCNIFLLLRVAIHSAVRVFTGEADEIATQSSCGFCVRIFDKLLRTLLFIKISHGFGTGLADLTKDLG